MRLLLAVCFFLAAGSVFAVPEQEQAGACQRTIYFLPQRHVPSTAEEDLGVSGKVLEEIAASQYAIGRFLNMLDSPVVFREGIVRDTVRPSKGDVKPVYLKAAEKAEKILAKPFADASTEEKEALVRLSSPLLLLLQGKVTTIRAVTPDERSGRDNTEAAMAFLKKHGQLFPDNKEGMELIFLVREKWALNQITRFFREHPEQKEAVLVYGALHNFPKYERLLPGICIKVPEEFKGALRNIEYDINADGLLQLP